ncbi:hypothetical protein [Paenibacillus timonensis]|jgi:hypothetical protein|nr:hypothetical protein [Paenibacillus timonensis]
MMIKPLSELSESGFFAGISPVIGASLDVKEKCLTSTPAFGIIGKVDAL